MLGTAFIGAAEVGAGSTDSPVLASGARRARDPLRCCPGGVAQWFYGARDGAAAVGRRSPRHPRARAWSRTAATTRQPDDIDTAPGFAASLPRRRCSTAEEVRGARRDRPRGGAAPGPTGASSRCRCSSSPAIYFFDEFDTAAFGVLAPNIEKSFHISDRRSRLLVIGNLTILLLLVIPLSHYADRLPRRTFAVVLGAHRRRLLVLHRPRRQRAGDVLRPPRQRHRGRVQHHDAQLAARGLLRARNSAAGPTRRTRARSTSARSSDRRSPAAIVCADRQLAAGRSWSLIVPIVVSGVVRRCGCRSRSVARPTTSTPRSPRARRSRSRCARRRGHCWRCRRCERQYAATSSSAPGIVPLAFLRAVLLPARLPRATRSGVGLIQSADALLLFIGISVAGAPHAAVVREAPGRAAALRRSGAGARTGSVCSAWRSRRT